MYLKIGETEITKCINESSYDVNIEAEYDEWTDAGYAKHRNLLRNRIKGKMSLVFVGSLTIDYSTFLSLISANTSDSKMTITVYVPIEDANKTISVHYTLEADAPRDLKNGNTFRKVTFEFEEV